MPFAGDSIIPPPMLTRPTRLFLLLILAGAVVACGRKEDRADRVGPPSVKLSRTEAAVGSPIDMTYRFVMAPNAPALNDDYTVFVHVLDSDRERLWGDDHQPPTPTREWKPGSTIEYTRTMFVPKFPYV